MERNKRVCIRLTLDEYKMLEKLCEKWHMSKTAVIVRMLLEEENKKAR